MNSGTPERRRVLVIDDNPDIHGDFRKTLEPRSSTGKLAHAAAMLFGPADPATSSGLDFEVESALQGQDGQKKVAQALRDGKPYAIAFVDMRMPPGWDGVETIQHLWEIDPELQVVICSAYSDYSWDRIVEKLGTTDRLLVLKKPFDPIEVCQMATALTEKWKLKRQATIKQAELERMVHERTRELRKLAMMDKLTGLPNRACIYELLTQSVARASTNPSFNFAVLFLDFDRFKLINDSLGHRAGDQLLIEIAARLRKLAGQSEDHDCLEGTCVAGRLGGDEFVILQRNINSAQDAILLADKILEGLGADYVLEGKQIHSSASIGIATSEAGYKWGEDILRDADDAMYRAKSQGRSRYVLFNPQMHRDAVTRLNLENDLRRAAAQNELELFYQPIVSLKDASLVGFEALLRWRHPEKGLIAPANFISLAEETGLIVPIGQWVIDEAARQLADWSRRIPAAANLHMSVNCSRKQFIDVDLCKGVAAALARTGLAPGRFNLEITESTMMKNPGEHFRILSEIRALGVKLHMDDFGTGYSSLNYLHEFPLDVLKIDKSFVHNVSERRNYAAVVNAIITLAHNLGMEVVAEGIETADHTSMLCALDADMGQGYFFARPLPAADAEAFIVTPRPDALTTPAGGETTASPELVRQCA